MSMRGRPPGFSPSICIRSVNRIYTSTAQLAYRTRVLRPHERRIETCASQHLSWFPFDLSSGRTSKRTPTFSVTRHFSQATAAVQGDLEVPSSTEQTLPEIPEDLEQLTVKELRALLIGRGLKTTGLKKELIERLQAVTQDGLAATDVNTNESGTSVSPDSAADEGVNAVELSKLSVKELRAMLAERGMSTQGLKAQLIARLENTAQMPLPQSDKVHEIFQQLETSNAQTTELKSQVVNFKLKPPTSPPKTPSPPRQTAFPTDTGIPPRQALRAQIYFAKVFNDGLNSDPSTTNPVILAELMAEDEGFLCRAFLNHVSLTSQHGRILEEKELHGAWMSALEKLMQRKNSWRYTAAPTKRTVLSIEREPKPKSAEEPPRPMQEEDTSTSISVNPAEGLKIEDLDAKVPNNRRQRGWLSRNAWTNLIRLNLSDNPITLRLQLNSELRRRYTHISRETKPEASDLLNPMWTRLGLVDHIQGIRDGPGDGEYLVTFKTFDAAAAFVNQVNQHWIDDEMTGQVYVTWDPIETQMDNVRAILSFPRATIEPWRVAAQQRKVEISKYGFATVDWGRSLQSVFRRMNITAGRKGTVRSWTVVGEYANVVIMEISFIDMETMKYFVAQKDEHYLSNPWKDRFFVKQKDRLFPEWMPEPTRENPVPRAKDMSIIALKRVWRGKV